MSAESISFSVRPAGIIDMVRSMYWQEWKKEEAVSILQCFKGITGAQIDKILHGHATITTDYRFIEKEDFAFQKELREIQGYNLQFMELGGRRVRRELVDEYCGHIVKRLRDSMKRDMNGLREGRFDPLNKSLNDLITLTELEDKRRELHEAIIMDAGFNLDERGKESWSNEFRRFMDALSDLTDRMAGEIV